MPTANTRIHSIQCNSNLNKCMCQVQFVLAVSHTVITLLNWYSHMSDYLHARSHIEYVLLWNCGNFQSFPIIFSFVSYLWESFAFHWVMLSTKCIELACHESRWYPFALLHILFSQCIRIRICGGGWCLPHFMRVHNFNFHFNPSFHELYTTYSHLHHTCAHRSYNFYISHNCIIMIWNAFAYTQR